MRSQVELSFMPTTNQKYIINKLSYSDVENQMRTLQGRILTIIDAVIADKNQNKNVKDLINSQFSERLNVVWKIAIKEHPSIYDTGERTIEKDIEHNRRGSTKK